MAINLDPKRTNITWFGGNTRAVSPIKAGDPLLTFLTNLNSKMDLVIREWDYWDIYKFESSVNDNDDLTSAIAGLTPNHSLVINTTFAREDESYNRGDVILKKENGDIIHIPSRSPGIFYPATFEKNDGTNTYTLTYKYAATTADLPVGSGSGTDISFDPNNGYQSSALMIDSGSNSTAYAIREELSADHLSIMFPAIENLNPIVKTFLGSWDGGAEEIYINYNIVNDNDNYVITFDIINDFPSNRHIFAIVK